MSDNEYYDDDDVVDCEVDDFDLETEPEKEKSKFEKALDWAREHKIASIAGAVGTVVASVFVGGKLFSKTKTVEVEKLPDPTIMDKYDRIPVEEHSYTDYKYVLKPEYRDEE